MFDEHMKIWEWHLASHCSKRIISRREFGVGRTGWVCLAAHDFAGWVGMGSKIVGCLNRFWEITLSLAWNIGLRTIYPFVRWDMSMLILRMHEMRSRRHISSILINKGITVRHPTHHAQTPLTLILRDSNLPKLLTPHLPACFHRRESSRTQ